MMHKSWAIVGACLTVLALCGCDQEPRSDAAPVANAASEAAAAGAEAAAAAKDAEGPSITDHQTQGSEPSNGSASPGAPAASSGAPAAASASQFGKEYSQYVALSTQAANANCTDATQARGYCSDDGLALLNSAHSHLVLAVKDGDLNGAKRFLSDDQLPDAVWDSAGPSIVALADRFLGTKSPQARAYLRLAGEVVAAGNGVPKNYDRATLYYGTAWAIGDATSAALAANTYYALHDYVNSYLWSIRCIGDCDGNKLRVSVSDLEGSLDGQTLKTVQNKAPDSSVLAL